LQKGKMWLFDVILKATSENTNESSLFLSEIKSIIDCNVMIDLSQVIVFITSYLQASE